MKTNGGRMRRVLVWLGVAWLSLVTTSPLSAHQPTLRDTLKGRMSLVFSVTYSPDGKSLASGSLDKTIKLWDVQTGKVRATLKGHMYRLLSVAFSPDGKTLASGSGQLLRGGELMLWDVQTGKEQATLKGHTGRVRSVAFSPDGKTL